MVNVSSLPVSGNALFDLDTQAGITAVLLAVRASDIPANQKNELRDLVFLYTNGGKDQSVRLSLEQKIASFGLTPVALKVAPAAPVAPKREQPTIGNFRNAPAFAVPVVPIIKAEEVTPVSVAAPVAEPAPVVRSLPVATAPVPEVPTPVVTPTPTPAPVDEDIVVVPPVQMPKADQQQYLERIREIKSAVNEKVGNPVNLVDINNEVGREYMSALLDAMKRINSGMSADGAMQRLETAFLSVEETLRNMGTAPATVAEAAPQYVPPAPVPPVTYVTPVAEPTPAPYVPPAPLPVYEPPAPVASPIPQYQSVAPTTPIYEPVATTSQFQATQPAPHFEPVSQPVVPTPNYNQPVSAPAPTVHTPTPHTFSSLADMVQQSNAQAGLPTTPSAPAPLVSGDPLLAPEVEDGLTQLLSEWSIFKKSGIFGTGPKGREHPLYKKMSELQIPLLLAGRFEGATQEVRQSLTDYMNGWRYEQGLIYEKGETFEHYLRRVIRHILDQQKR